ncbi:hypothetical protein CRUP_005477 [Coryphaenoides rupestris]|nr:hypothetical protein CRUP_005477 [Coryphaenoides rupestris]
MGMCYYAICINGTVIKTNESCITTNCIAQYNNTNCTTQYNNTNCTTQYNNTNCTTQYNNTNCNTQYNNSNNNNCTTQYNDCRNDHGMRPHMRMYNNTNCNTQYNNNNNNNWTTQYNNTNCNTQYNNSNNNNCTTQYNDTNCPTHVFEACHSVVSPDKFLAGCIFDSCHMTNPVVQCTSLQVYAAACAQAGVCMYWRNYTTLCPSNCPANKVYKPCGPAEPPTCEDNPVPQFQQPRVRTAHVPGRCRLPQGYKYVENTDPKRCCGRCVQTHCVVNMNTTVKLVKDGETWSPPGNTCEFYTCLKSDDTFTTIKSHVICPLFDKSNCQADTIQTSVDGCCKICVEKKKGCKLGYRKVQVLHNGCQAKNEVHMTYCEGACNTFTRYSEFGGRMQHNCACCRELRYSNRTVDLACTNGDVVPFTYIHIEECRCGPTNCDTTTRPLIGRSKRRAAIGV